MRRKPIVRYRSPFDFTLLENRESPSESASILFSQMHAVGLMAWLTSLMGNAEQAPLYAVAPARNDNVEDSTANTDVAVVPSTPYPTSRDEESLERARRAHRDDEAADPPKNQDWLNWSDDDTLGDMGVFGFSADFFGSGGGWAGDDGSNSGGGASVDTAGGDSAGSLPGATQTSDNSAGGPSPGSISQGSDFSGPTPEPTGTRGSTSPLPAPTPRREVSQNAIETANSLRPDTPSIGHDVDRDGVSREIEAQAPNRGDGNRDGRADEDQPDVATLRASSNGALVTIDAAGRELKNVRAHAAPRHSIDGTNLPLGLFGFEVHGVAPGGATTVRLFMPDGVGADTYLKHDSTTGSFERFDFDGITGAVIAGNEITLHFVDGGRGDADGLANGIIVDPGGPGSTGTLMTIPCPNPAGTLDGWTAVESGGSTNGKGTITAVSNDYYLLSEGDSHLVSLQRDFVVPENPSFLKFHYSNLNLDLTDPDSINDAFEASLVDPATGQTFVYTIGPGRSSFFNITEGVGAATGQGTTHASQKVKLDISQLFPGTTVRLQLRLVNNDSDTETSVRILCDEVTVSGATSVYEGSTYNLNLNSHSQETISQWSINWGDGISEDLAGTTTSAMHVYADGTQVYPVTVHATTDDGLMYANPWSVQVDNDAPTWTTTSTEYEVVEGPDGTDRLVMHVAGSFSDPGFTRVVSGTEETFTVPINWGDGYTETITPIVIQGSPGVLTTGSFTASHIYERGDAVAAVTVADDDGGTDVFNYVVARIKVKPVVDPADLPSSIEYLGTIPVVVHSVAGFDATKIDPASLWFGPPDPVGDEGAREAHLEVHPHDELPDDGLQDVMTHYDILDTGFLQRDPLSFVLGAPAILTATVGAGSSLPAGTPVFGLDNLGVLADELEGVEEVLDTKVLANNSKFFVVDNGTDSVYRYQATSAANGSFVVNPAASDPRGIASNLVGDTVWVIDATTRKVSVQGPTGTLKGSWTVTDVTNPQGIVNQGLDLWIVDKGSLRVNRYVGAALTLFGSETADSFFQLHADNSSPSDVTTDGQFVWVTDDMRDEVFVYSTSGALQGRWQLDIENRDSSGITRNPAGGDDLWVLDRVQKRVYRYEGAMDRRSGVQGYTDRFVLAGANASPEGIADPCPFPNMADGGTDFWITIPGSAASSPISLDISAEVGTSGTITIPGLNFSENFSVGAGAITSVELPFDARLTTSDTIENLGIHVTSLDDVRVYLASFIGPDQDRYAALPVETLGTDYIVVGYENNASAFYASEFAIVASQNNTTVTIVPTVTTNNHAAGVPYTITLNQGRTYQLRNYTANGDLTGTIITSDKPIAVFGGHEYAVIGDANSQPAHIAEQLPPTSGWFEHFVSMPIADHPGADLFRIMAAHDGTTLWIDGVEVDVLSRGEFHEVTLDDPAEIIADRPVLVAQYAQSRDGVGDDDVYMMLVPSVDQWSMAYTMIGAHIIAVPVNGTYSAEYVNLLAPAAAVGQITFRGTAIAPSQFVQIGSSGYYGAQIPFDWVEWPEGQLRLESPIPFGAMHYTVQPASPNTGTNVGEYGYPLGLSVPVPTLPTIEIVSPAEGTQFPAGSFQIISGLVNPGSAPIVSVAVNGVPVDALDAANNFFTRVQVAPGINSFTFTALDARDQTATATLTITGVPTGVTSDNLFDVTPSLSTQYGRTSFNEATDNLYADVTVQNSGQYTIGTPLWIVVSNITEPSVALRDPDGFTNEGLPYYDFSAVMTGTTLAPGASTPPLSMTFYNPRNATFNYDLAYLSRLNRPPSFTSVPKIEAIATRNYSYAATAADPDGDQLAFDLLIGPSAMTVNSSTGVVSWTPASGDIGLHDVVLRVQDSRGGSAEQQFKLNVIATPPNRPPIFSNVPPSLAFANTPYVFTATASDSDGDTLTFGLISPPSGMSINGQTGVVTWTPASSQVGGQSATFEVTDGQGGSARLAFSFCVLPEAGTVAPILISTPVTTAIQQGQTYTYTAKAVDADGDSLTYSLPTAPSGMSINSSTGRITWDTTGANLQAHGVTVKVVDGRGWTDTQSFSVTVSNSSTGQISGAVFDDADGDGIRDPGENGLSGRTVYLDQNQNGLFDAGEITATTDGSGTYSLSNLAAATYRVGLQPLSGRVTTAPSGGFFIVTLSAGQTVSDRDFGSKSVPAGDNQAPQFASTAPTSASVGELYRYDAKATDADGDALTFDLPVAPASMTVDGTTGTVVWRPTADQARTHDVLLRVRDGKGGVKLQSFQVTVPMLNTAPVITSVAGTQALKDKPFYYAVRAQDAEGNTLAYSLDSASIAAGMLIGAATGIVTWTPSQSQVGTHTATVTVTDGMGGSAAETFTLNILDSATNRSPVLSSATPPTKVQLGGRYVYRVRATDADSDPLAFSFDVSPTGMTIDSQGLIQWQPTQQQLGDNNVVVRISDGRGGVIFQSFTVSVLTQYGNQAPTITSAPTLGAIVGRPYSYNLKAIDPEFDPVFWRLDKAPAGMSIDSELGTLRWLPGAHQVGTQDVVIRASDARGLWDTQTFTLDVAGCNVAPLIASTPPVTGYVGTRYYYAVRATDSNRDALTFSLVTKPDRMTIDSATGLIRWMPIAAGTSAVTVRASDGQGGSSEQIFSLVIAAAAPNRPPVIESQPSLFARVGFQYTYQVDACDPDGDELTYAVSQTPNDGMQINSTTGLITWTPSAAGTYSVVVTVTDATGKSARQYFRIAATVNQAPDITSSPKTTEIAGRLYRYDVRATDGNNDPLTWTLDAASVARGMQIDAFGRITWQIPPKPKTAPNDVYSVTVTVTDPYGAFDPQTYNLTVTADTVAPVLRVEHEAQLRLNTDPVDNGVVRGHFVVRATDNVKVTYLRLTVKGPGAGGPETNVRLDRHGFGTVDFTQEGTYTVTAVAKDAAGNETTATSSLQVIDILNNVPPTVRIDSPVAGATITAPTNVVGEISDPENGLVSWKLELVPYSGGQTRTLATGSTPVNGVIGQVDPTLLANGTYTLRVTATDNAGWIKTREQNLSVAGNLKLGDFKLEFTDLTVRVSGIPISIRRTYDTLNADTQGDMGYGWRLSFGDPDLEVSIPNAGTGWGRWSPFKDGTRIFLTTPDGQRQGFTFVPVMVNSFFQLWAPDFVPDSDNSAILEVQDAQLYRTTDGEYFSYDEAGLHSYNPADPVYGGKYTLHTLDLLKYDIDADKGTLMSVSDVRGNNVTFKENALESNTGRKVTITRDPQGRVIRVTDPRGQAGEAGRHYVEYDYDSRGDLVKFTDRLGNSMQFTYRTDKPHYLDKVVDPFGRTGVKTEYNTGGRLSEVRDAQGNATSASYNLTNLSETVVDPTNHSATAYYDNRGNEIKLIDFDSTTTLRDFDSFSRTTRSTLVVGQVDDPSNGETDDITTTYDYRDRRTLANSTDALGNVTRFTHNDATQVTSVSDPQGNTSQFVYADPSGGTSGPLMAEDLKAMVNPTGVSRSFDYDANGNLAGYIADVDFRRDGSDPPSRPEYAQATFQHNSFGDLIGSVGPTGAVSSNSIDANGNFVSSSYSWTDPLGNPKTVTFSHDFDGEDRVVQSTGPDGTEEFEYDILGRIVERGTPNGTTAYKYDSRGNTVETTQANGFVSRVVFDEVGRPIWQTDAQPLGRPRNGNRFYYDGAGRVIKDERYANVVVDLVPQPDGSLKSVFVSSDPTPLRTIINEYNADGTLRSTTNADGLTTTFQYDKLGRELSAAQVVGSMTIQTQKSYDASGNLVRERDALGRETRYEHDDAGRQTRITRADGSTVSMTYTPRGQIASRTNELGKTTNYSFDVSGNLIAVELPAVLDPVTQTQVRPRFEYEFNQRNGLRIIRDPYGRENSIDYDDAGRQIAWTRPDVAGKPTATESRTYDSAGRLATVTDFNGRIRVNQYDSMGRLSLVKYFASAADQAANLPSETQAYSYDIFDVDGLRHNTVTVTSGALISVYDYAYNVEGNLVAISSPEGTVNYGYSSNNRLTRTFTANSDLFYEHDARGLVVEIRAEKQLGVTLTTPEITTNEYNENGGLTKQTLPNGIETTFAYDLRDQLKYLSHRDSSGDLLDSYYYLRDGAGRPTTVFDDYLQADVETALGNGQWINLKRTGFSYDATDRLLQENHFDENVTNPLLTKGYTWDLANNLVTKTSQEGSTTESNHYSINARDEIVSEVYQINAATQWTAAYTYDQSGALIGRSRTGKVEAFDYDVLGRLAAASIEEQVGGSTIQTDAEYKYDLRGIRRLATVVVNDGVSTSTQTTRFVNDPQSPYGFSRVIDELNGSGVVQASFVHGAAPISQARTAGTSFYLNDGHSGVRHLTNPAELLTDTYDFDAFGLLLAGSGATTNTLLYRGEQWDNALQMYDLRARPYEPASARFQQLDPLMGNLGNPATLNKYLYAGADPLRFVDPSGESFGLSAFAVSIGIQISGMAMKASADLRAGADAKAAHLGRLIGYMMIFNLYVTQVEEPALMGPLGPAWLYNLTLARAAVRNTAAYLKDNRRAQWDIVKFGLSLGTLLFIKVGVSATAGGKDYVLWLKSNGFPRLTDNSAFWLKGSQVWFKLTGTYNGDRARASSLTSSITVPGGIAYQWHHHEVVGIMLRVLAPIHLALDHIGGRLFWSCSTGRGYT